MARWDVRIVTRIEAPDRVTAERDATLMGHVVNGQVVGVVSVASSEISRREPRRGDEGDEGDGA